jgi:hypothetical protein
MLLLALILAACAVFLALGVFAAASSRDPTRSVYLASAAVSAIALVIALGYLLFATLVLPLGPARAARCRQTCCDRPAAVAGR